MSCDGKEEHEIVYNPHAKRWECIYCGKDFGKKPEPKEAKKE